LTYETTFGWFFFWLIRLLNARLQVSGLPDRTGEEMIFEGTMFIQKLYQEAILTLLFPVQFIVVASGKSPEVTGNSEYLKKLSCIEKGF